ncbi:MAG: hypothetical protein NUV53_03550 [Patescibacteria group bacterium]|nr:hypothetical protein [Patescibacteria group bacterium]
MLQTKKQKTVQWTNHAHSKMRYYGLSEQRVRRVLHSPKRVEEGIAPKTVAMMQPFSILRIKDRGIWKEQWKQELWVMIQDGGNIRKIISAWRYPGMTKPGTALPDEVLREIRAGVALSRESVETEEEVREKMTGMLRKWRRKL